MPESVHRFLAAIMLPDGPQQELAALQARHGLPPWEPVFPRLHITLARPFDTAAGKDALAAALGPVAARKPFPVALDGFGRFDHRESILFAHVARSPELDALAGAAVAALGAFSHRFADPRFPFTPHVTLAAAAPRESVDGWMQRLIQEPLSLEFSCDRFTLLELRPGVERGSTEASRPNVDRTARQWHIVRDFTFAP